MSLEIVENAGGEGQTRSAESWYAIHVRPRFEQLVSTALSGKGYEEYLPVYSSRRTWSDRKKEIDLPLFPGYLFCRFDVQRRLPILTTPGVISIIGVGKTPEAIPDAEIDAVKATVNSGLHLQPWPQLVIGSKVMIEQGPLKGVEGIAMDFKKKFRLFVSVPMLQRSVSVEIDREWVRPLPIVIASRSSSSADKHPAIGKVA